MSNILSEPFPVLDSTNSAPDANTNGSPLSLAIARASNVFPVPGGPLINIPCQKQTHEGHFKPQRTSRIEQQQKERNQRMRFEIENLPEEV